MAVYVKNIQSQTFFKNNYVLQYLYMVNLYFSQHRKCRLKVYKSFFPGLTRISRKDDTMLLKTNIKVSHICFPTIFKSCYLF